MDVLGHLVKGILRTPVDVLQRRDIQVLVDKLVAIVPKEYGVDAVEIIKGCQYGENACMIGSVNEPTDESEQGALIMKTEIGGRRFLDILQGEGLPRIC